MATQLSTRRPCINTRTKNFHFSVGFDPQTGQPVEFFITGRGKVGQELDTELYELSVEASKLMQGEYWMICPDCQKVMVRAATHEGGAIKWLPCPRCNGSGIAYCCDGERIVDALRRSHPKQKPGQLPI